MSEASQDLTAPIRTDLFEQIFSRIESINWFARTGLKSTDEIEPYADQYLSGLGFSTDLIQVEDDVRKLEDYIKYRFDEVWIDAESRAHRDLNESIRSSGYEEALDHLVKRVASELSSRVLYSAGNNLAGANKYLVRVAAGSATETCFRYALEAISSPESSNVFTSKLEMFRLGRWPLCLSGGKFIIH